MNLFLYGSRSQQHPSLEDGMHCGGRMSHVSACLNWTGKERSETIGVLGAGRVGEIEGESWDPTGGMGQKEGTGDAGGDPWSRYKEDIEWCKGLPGYTDPSGLAEMPAPFPLDIPVLSLSSFHFQQDVRESLSGVSLTGHHQGDHCCEHYCEGIEAPDCWKVPKTTQKIILLCVNQPDIGKAFVWPGQQGRQGCKQETHLPSSSSGYLWPKFCCCMCAKGSGLGNTGCVPFCCSFPPFYPGINFLALLPRAIHFQS